MMVAASPLSAQQIGTVSVHGAAIRSLAPDEPAWRGGVRVDISFVAGRFTLGPEAGLYFTGPEAMGAAGGRGENVVTLGGVGRRYFTSGGWRPFVVAGLGWYGWESSRPTAPTGSYLSGSAGLGVVRAVAGAGSGPSVEARLHQQLAGDVRGTRRFVTLTAGLTLGW
jgi:hypothetical protein